MTTKVKVTISTEDGTVLNVMVVEQAGELTPVELANRIENLLQTRFDVEEGIA